MDEDLLCLKREVQSAPSDQELVLHYAHALERVGRFKEAHDQRVTYLDTLLEEHAHTTKKLLAHETQKLNPFPKTNFLKQSSPLTHEWLQPYELFLHEGISIPQNSRHYTSSYLFPGGIIYTFIMRNDLPLFDTRREEMINYITHGIYALEAVVKRLHPNTS